MTVYNSLHSLLDYECLLFSCDEWQMKNPYLLNHWTPLRGLTWGINLEYAKKS
jgi:hypothetical protein